MEISDDFYLNISTISTYLVKYFEPSMYSTMSNQLHTTAISNGDPKDHSNYVGPFLCSLKQQLRYIETKISCQLINVITRAQTPPDIPKVAINTATVEEKETIVCTVCTSDHNTLMKCPQFPDFIPGPSTQPLPDTVCSTCLRTAGDVKYCHRPNPRYMCHKTKKHTLL